MQLARLPIPLRMNALDLSEETCAAGTELLSAIATRDEALIGRMMLAIHDAFLQRCRDCANEIESDAPSADVAARMVLRVAPLELDARVVIDAYAILTDKPVASEIKIQRARQLEGPALWKVSRDGNCLNKSGEWEWEPMPSSRDDEFIARCRFESAGAALLEALK